VSKALFDNFALLAMNPDYWGQQVSLINDEAAKFTKHIEPGTLVSWSENLASLIIEFENFASPCNS
jgi:hypothetical protein